MRPPAKVARGTAVAVGVLIAGLLTLQLEELTGDLIERTVAICKRTLEEAEIDKKEIQDVILVGGMTRMPAVQEAVKAFRRLDTYDPQRKFSSWQPGWVFDREGYFLQRIARSDCPA